MGIFSGYLLVSDIDGTFTGIEPEVCESNASAVKYFTENGGRFTFATGRMVKHLLDEGLSALINAPASLTNGSYIYDYESGKAVREVRLGYKPSEYLDAIKGILPETSTVQLYYPGSFGFTTALSMAQAREFLIENPGIASEAPLKIVVRFPTVESADLFKASARALPFFKDTYIAKAWRFGVEFNPISGTKGAAIRYLKDLLPDVHTTVAIGDYENDLSMIESADIGVAVGGAMPCVLEAADMTVCSCAEYAVADLVYRLETMIKDGSIERIKKQSP